MRATQPTNDNEMAKSLFNKIYNFYRYDCCWPYAVSFLLVLVIYRIDFIDVNRIYHWESIFSYGIIFSYYLYNLHLYYQKKIVSSDTRFFIRFLTFKIFIWGFILILFCLTQQ
ncbi:MAG: hypothetical protein NTW64_01030 [Candidatus Omnitrophica bacterium]|nr:hypothetical protein [Candidatus Omnitrophota bacterium]